MKISLVIVLGHNHNVILVSASVGWQSDPSTMEITRTTNRPSHGSHASHAPQWFQEGRTKIGFCCGQATSHKTPSQPRSYTPQSPHSPPFGRHSRRRGLRSQPHSHSLGPQLPFCPQTSSASLALLCLQLPLLGDSSGVEPTVSPSRPLVRPSPVKPVVSPNR